MAASDKALGSAMLLVAAFVFIYYTAWALLQPFLPADSPLQPLFPPREWAVRLPALLLVGGGAAVSAFIGNVMLKESRKRRAKAQGKAA